MVISNPNKPLYHFISLVTHLLIPILIDLDVYTKNVVLKSKNAWLVSFMSLCHFVNVYFLKNYTPASLSSCLFIQIMLNDEQHVALPHRFIRFATQDGNC